jgi:hypothetical protein
LKNHMAQAFKPGQIFPQSGVHAITRHPTHADMPHEVIVIRAQRFPTAAPQGDQLPAYPCSEACVQSRAAYRAGGGTDVDFTAGDAGQCGEIAGFHSSHLPNWIKLYPSELVKKLQTRRARLTRSSSAVNGHGFLSHGPATENFSRGATARPRKPEAGTAARLWRKDRAGLPGNGCM